MDGLDNGAITSSGRLSEKQVVRVWQGQLLEKTGLATEDGYPLEIIYPGRPNDDRGADFKDAVISFNRNVLKGDVELHVRSSDWHAHGHDRDAAYNRVILHVVMWHNSLKATALENGREVPVLAVEKHLRPGVTSSPCGTVEAKFAGILLDKAGDRRFNQKVRFIRGRLRDSDARQVLYEGIMEALGYSKNKIPFLELSRRVTIKDIETLTQSGITDQECLRRLQRLLLSAADKITGWNTFKVRPGNSPAHRIMAVSRLFIRFRKNGLMELLKPVLDEKQAVPGSQTGELKKALAVNASGSRDGITIALLGSGRAADIIVNVLLPFSYAFGQAEGRPELRNSSRRLYRQYPGESVNSVVRHMASQLGLRQKEVNIARRQQGLLQIHKEFCIQGRCGECPLSQFQPGEGVQLQAVTLPGDEPVISASGYHSGVIGTQFDRRN